MRAVVRTISHWILLSLHLSMLRSQRVQMSVVLVCQTEVLLQRDLAAHRSTLTSGLRAVHRYRVPVRQAPIRSVCLRVIIQLLLPIQRDVWIPLALRLMSQELLLARLQRWIYLVISLVMDQLRLVHREVHRDIATIGLMRPRDLQQVRPD